MPNDEINCTRQDTWKRWCGGWHANNSLVSHKEWGTDQRYCNEYTWRRVWDADMNCLSLDEHWWALMYNTSWNTSSKGNVVWLERSRSSDEECTALRCFYCNPGVTVQHLSYFLALCSRLRWCPDVWDDVQYSCWWYNHMTWMVKKSKRRDLGLQSLIDRIHVRNIAI